MVHPNNHLTKLDKFTIPNLESYKKALDSQINKLTNYNSKTSVENRLLNYKQVEKNYIGAYLNILKLLEGVENCCTTDGCYDYEQEDNILNSIEIEMIEFKKNELKLKELKSNATDVVEPRRESIIKVEEDMVENVETHNVEEETKS